LIKYWLKRSSTGTATAAVALLIAVQVMVAAVPVYGAGNAGGDGLGAKSVGIERAVARSVGAGEETQVDFPMDAGPQDVPVEVFGTIETALISVTMPSDGFEFLADPEQEFDAVNNPEGQITGPEPDKWKVTNHSVVPVRLEIASVKKVEESDVSFSEKFPGGPEQAFSLVDKIAKVRTPGTAILVLADENKTYTSDADFEQYAICPGRSGIFIADLEADQSVGLKLCGKVAPDFYGAYQFTVRPTLKISAVRAR